MASSDADVVQRVQQAVAQALDRHGLLDAPHRMVVAVSGGADSLCLLDALVTVVPDPTRRLFVGHVDHQLRPESGADAEHVRQAAATRGLPCEIVGVNVPALAAAERRGIEETARLARYGALRAFGDAVGTDVAATGHTRDDSVETVLMHLLRGSGRTGLGGIAADDYLELGAGDDPPRLRVVRPLLRVGRAETSAYCQSRGIRWLDDPTNSDPKMLRNRVRHHLLPVLRTYNPAVDDALDRLSEVMRDEDAYLFEATIRRYRDLVSHRDGHSWLNLRLWGRLPIALQRRVVREIAQDLGWLEISLEAIERALAVGRENGPPRAELGGGMTVERRADTLSFTRT
jgi:tRNA(Ile)-lysidine synthetase-like protein